MYMPCPLPLVGKPVIVQDTGFSEYIPLRGLLAFSPEDEDCEAPEWVKRDS